MKRWVAPHPLLFAVLSLGVLRMAGAESSANLTTRAQPGTGANTAVVSFVMAQVGTGAGVMISGLSIPPGAGHRQMLVRAAGPALTTLGTTGALSDPAIALFDSAGVQIASNDNWESNAAAVIAASTKAGAFPFAPNSKDAAVIANLGPGNYTIQVSSVGGDTGTALVEVYDVTPAENLANASVVDLLATVVRNQATVSAPLLLHLPLTDNINDASPNHVAVRMHGVTIRNGAAWFDGHESELAFPHQAFDHRAFAVAMWVKLESDYPTCGLVEQRSANRPNQHLHLMIRDTVPYLGFYVNDLRTGVPVTPRDGWTHLVFQYTGRRQEVWINGRSVGARRARAFAGTEGEFVVGRTPRWTNVPSRDFQGGMRDLRVYGRALTAEEISVLAQH